MGSLKEGIFYPGIWSRAKKIRQKLIREFGKCYWCGISVKEYPHSEHVKCPHDQATLDHLVSKSAGRKKGEIVPKVLACYKCNFARGLKDLREKQRLDKLSNLGDNVNQK